MADDGIGFGAAASGDEEGHYGLLGIEERARALAGSFAVVRVNEDFTLDFVVKGKFRPQHFAFAMDGPEFEKVFGQIKDAGIAYGDGPYDVSNMKGPSTTQGARGEGKAVYFRDPNGHILEIKTY